MRSFIKSIVLSLVVILVLSQSTFASHLMKN